MNDQGRPTEAPPIDNLELLLVTGMSGAGKTAATAALDDIGWFVVDNLPPSLLMDLVTTVTTRTDLRRVAVVADVRGGVFFSELRGALDRLGEQGIRPTVLFLEAGDEALVRRFESARRPHPLQAGGGSWRPSSASGRSWRRCGWPPTSSSTPRC